MVREIRRTVVGCVILALLVVGCGEPGAGGGGGDADAPTSGEPETLGDFFGWGNEDPAAAEARWREEEARIQELIRVCMAEEGFEYLPVVPPDDAYVISGPEDEEERVRTEGFGITTWYGNEEQFDPGVEWHDPNQEIIEAMTDSEIDAYYAALHGTEEEQMEDATVEIDPETGEEMVMYEGFGAGCYGEASEEVYGSQNASNALWEELSPELEAMYERVQADPRIVELDTQWVACMAEAGFEFESRNKMHETIYDDFQKRVDEIVGVNGGYGDPFVGWTQDEIDAFFEEKTDDEINAFFEQAQAEAQADIDQEALTALQQEEIQLATADFECGQDHLEAWTEVSRDYETEFIAAHRQQLEQIRDAESG